MVTSNQLPEKNIVKMDSHSVAVVPLRTLLGEVNEHITCPLCRGYYIDATTIVECLHSFCRSCIIKHLQAKSYCPVCEMMINSAKPNIKLDKALQDIVYKLVPGLFQKEMERRQQFYSSRPGPAASATPEQRGEDTERIIFSPEDVISFSLEYADVTDTDSISSKSSDSNEPQSIPAIARRYLQCPAVVNINHLKKFLSMKFDIDSTQFAIDILYKRVPLPDYYTLMDIAYIYNWKRNEPMRFFYQIIDYVAIRNRFFDINKKSSHFKDRKPSLPSIEDANACSPAPNLNEQGSEGSSGADSPMPDDNTTKDTGDINKKPENSNQPESLLSIKEDSSSEKLPCVTLSKKNDEDVEKSQFLISFELTAKNNKSQSKSSPTKINKDISYDVPSKSTSLKVEDHLKRKYQTSVSTPDSKKFKVDHEKTSISNVKSGSGSVLPPANVKISEKTKDSEGHTKTISNLLNMPPSTTASKETKVQPLPAKHPAPDVPAMKRTNPGQHNTSSPKRKAVQDISVSNDPSIKKTVSPLKLQIPKLDSQVPSILKSADLTKTSSKKIPDLKPSIAASHSSQSKVKPASKVRMDLLANNSDPTIDRSKILSQVKTSLSSQSNGQGSGDPLKSIFDSCNINIPSSLSITLTDQKLDARVALEAINTDQKKSVLNKNLVAVNKNPSHKVPSPPVHNYIEILKLSDTDTKSPTKNESNTDAKSNLLKPDSNVSQTKPQTKSSEVSAKGPVPNLKPISDTKIGKQTASTSAPITFQQTFEQQLQSLQTDKKPKVPKAKTQVPKLVPAPKVFNVVSKTMTANNKPIASSSQSLETKSSSALDLSTPHNILNQGGAQQTFDKALETMQSIANLAKKQNLPAKGMPLMSQSNTFSGVAGRPISSGVSPLRVPSVNNPNQIKVDKLSMPNLNVGRLELPKNNPNKVSTNTGSTVSSSNYHNISSSSTQPSPRSQTRSPSCSPKLVIAEDKQASSSLDQSVNQGNSMITHQLPILNISKPETPKASPGHSKSGLKPVRPVMTPPAKNTTVRPPMPLNPSISNSADYLSRPQLMSSHHHLLRQMEVNAWLKVQRQFDFIKSMSNMGQNDFNSNNKDKQK